MKSIFFTTMHISAYRSFLLLALLLLFNIQIAFAKKKPKVLIFSKTMGFHHNSIDKGIIAIQQLGKQNNFDTDTSTNSARFTFDQLRQYKVVIFLSPTGDILNDLQQQAFEKYIHSGGGFVGIHAATDCEPKWQWYGNLVGAYFGGHPNQQMAVLKVADASHISTKPLPAIWQRKDEWYNFKWMANDLSVLITIDEQSYDAGKAKMGNYHPVAWYHEYDGGRAFYTALGHTDESFSEPLFLQHLLGGIKYALGKKK